MNKVVEEIVLLSSDDEEAPGGGGGGDVNSGPFHEQPAPRIVDTDFIDVDRWNAVPNGIAGLVGSVNGGGLANGNLGAAPAPASRKRKSAGDFSVSITQANRTTKVKIVMENEERRNGGGDGSYQRPYGVKPVYTTTSVSGTAGTSSSAIKGFSLLPTTTFAAAQSSNSLAPSSQMALQSALAQFNKSKTVSISPAIGSVSITPVPPQATEEIVISDDDDEVVPLDGDGAPLIAVPAIRPATQEVLPEHSPTKPEKVPAAFITIPIRADVKAEAVSSPVKKFQPGRSVTPVLKAEPVEDTEVEMRLQQIVHICSSQLPRDEFEKVKRKFDKRKILLPTKFLKDVALAGRLQRVADSMLKDKSRIFLHVKDILDELRVVSCKIEPTSAVAGKPEATPGPSDVKPVKRATLISVPLTDVKPKSEEKEKNGVAEEPTETSKPGTSGSATSKPGTSGSKTASSKHLRRLEHALAQCHEHIRKLEESECDLDDDNSNYLKSSKYKARCMKLYKKIAECRKLDASLGRRQDKQFKFSSSRIPQVNARVTKWINLMRAEKKPVFPDFADILKLIGNLNEEQNLCLSKSAVDGEARDVFEAVGRSLKERRWNDDMMDLDAYIQREQADDAPVTELPPEPDDLKAKLDENQKLAKERLFRVFEEFERKQTSRGEEPEEVGDDDASSAKGDEDEDEDDDEIEADDDDDDLASELSSSVPHNDADDGNCAVEASSSSDDGAGEAEEG